MFNKKLEKRTETDPMQWNAKCVTFVTVQTLSNTIYRHPWKLGHADIHPASIAIAKTVKFRCMKECDNFDFWTLSWKVVYSFNTPLFGFRFHMNCSNFQLEVQLNLIACGRVEEKVHMFDKVSKSQTFMVLRTWHLNTCYHLLNLSQRGRLVKYKM